VKNCIIIIIININIIIVLMYNTHEHTMIKKVKRAQYNDKREQ